MSVFLVAAAIGGTLLLGAISPGPSFVMVVQTAMSQSRSAGLTVALGMGVGSVAFAVLALLGLQQAFEAVPALFAALKVAGGIYLLVLAFKIWRGASSPLDTDRAVDVPRRQAFLRGFTTQVANPKTAIVYASTFAAFAPSDGVGVPLALATVVTVFAVETAWYSTVAFSLSAERPRRIYLRAKTTLDRVASAVLATLAGRLIVSARAV